ncbi:MAG TPA: organic hydroperoxide resistance protein [Sphingomicrobium sp.]|nr:organic hydroperoxide resistance protein [Sphingomicrobium sp.]
MNKISNLIYTGRVHTTGGREGASRSDDDRLSVALTTPGGAGNGTNPEQLLAAGWSGCFLSAIQIAAREAKVVIPDGLAVDAEIDLGSNEGGYLLGARLNVSLPGVDPALWRALVDRAHQTCPYSQATRNNIAVEINLI